MFGNLALAISSLALFELLTTHSILDCPEQTQTSPIRMFFSVSVFLPLIVISNGPPDFSASSLIIHFLSSPALAVLVCPQKVTVTSSPGSAQPQIGTGMPCCS